MKKEYLILIALILLLGAYLLFHKENNDNYSLPAIVKMTPDKITALEIVRDKNSIDLVKKGEDWTLKNIDRPADKVAVENMLDALRDLKLSALVSEKKDTRRYELDEKNQIRVKVIEGDMPVFEFAMGKTAPTFNHTFVMIEKDSSIYHARGSFRTYFKKSIQDLRDKKVLKFNEKKITKFTIQKDGKSKTFTADQEEVKDKEPKITWLASDKSAIDTKSLSDLLSALSLLECESFSGDDKKQAITKADPFCSIQLHNGDSITLTLVKTKDAEQLSGISSMNPDAFALSKFNGDDIITHVDTLLGIKKEKPKE